MKLVEFNGHSRQWAYSVLVVHRETEGLYQVTTILEANNIHVHVLAAPEYNQPMPYLSKSLQRIYLKRNLNSGIQIKF